MVGVGGVVGEILLRAVPAVEHVGEGEGGGAVAVDFSGGEVEDHGEGVEAVETVDHGGELGGVGGGFDVEEDNVFDG